MPSENTGLVERLRAACVGHPDAKIAWPHRVLHEAAAAIERLEAANAALMSERTNLIETKRQQIDDLTKRVALAEQAEEAAKDCFWAVYPTYCETTGHGIGTEAARTALASRATAAEAQRDKLAEALRGMVARFELYAGPNDMHAGHHDLALLSAARAALSNLEPKP